MEENHHHHEDHCTHHDHHGHHLSKYEQMFEQYDLHLHDEEVQAQARIIVSNGQKEHDQQDVRKFLFSTLELTSLKVTDSEDTILQLTEKVNRFSDSNPDFPHLAAICVYPRFVSVVSNALEADGVELSTVCGGFPSSQTFPELKTIETALALKDGATEIDTVMPVGYFLAGDYEQVFDEVSEIKATCGEEITLKVILEAGALQSAVNIKKAALMAMYSGADFIKTSTGKIEPGARPDAVLTMCQTIKEYYEKTGRKIGIKIAGGVKTTEQALSYYSIVHEILGEEWLTPKWFRIGASDLANALLSDITGEKVNVL
ncbi:MAG: deoxyribose-phosphate aldolase [Bacteroidaceae bacterium]|nr:deoxyribose-phosphate aldolase [Bacteroidaceae bacterium]